MLAGPKCPIKCKWHLQGWTGSVHLSVDESCACSPLSNQFDVTLLCRATNMPREALLNRPVRQGPPDPRAPRPKRPHRDYKKFQTTIKTHKMITYKDKFTKKRCKPIMTTTTKRYKTIKERQNNCKDKNRQMPNYQKRKENHQRDTNHHRDKNKQK